LTIGQKLAKANPTVTGYQHDLAYNLARLGTVQRRSGRPAEAADSFKKAIAIMERLPRLTSGLHYDLACYLALLAGVAAEPGSKMAQTDSQAAADQAMAVLRRAVAAGYRDLANMRTDVIVQRPLFVRQVRKLHALAGRGLLEGVTEHAVFPEFLPAEHGHDDRVRVGAALAEGDSVPQQGAAVFKGVQRPFPHNCRQLPQRLVQAAQGVSVRG